MILRFSVGGECPLPIPYTMYASSSIICAIINTCSDVIVQHHKETTTTTTDATASATIIQQSQASQTSTPLPVLTVEPTSTLLLQGHESMPSTINQPRTSLGLGLNYESLMAESEEEIQSLIENITTRKRSYTSDSNPPPKKVM